MFVVAGASGKTGKVVADTLLAQGEPVSVIVRDAQVGEGWRRLGAKVEVLSLEDMPALARALEGASGLYTLLPEDAAAPDFHAHRRRMADAIAAAVEASRVAHVVLLSAGAAVLPDGNGPAKDLHYAETELRKTGSKLTAIRASYLQENILAALPAAIHDGIYPNFFPSIDVAMPMVATRDVGKLAARCLVEPPARSEVIDIVGPTYSVSQLADRLGAALGKSLRVVDVPASEHIAALTAAGVPMQLAAAVAEVYACFASGRVSPQGDRMVAGTTTLSDILPGLVAGGR